MNEGMSVRIQQQKHKRTDETSYNTWGIYMKLTSDPVVQSPCGSIKFGYHGQSPPNMVKSLVHPAHGLPPQLFEGIVQSPS